MNLEAGKEYVDWDLETWVITDDPHPTLPMFIGTNPYGHQKTFTKEGFAYLGTSHSEDLVSEVTFRAKSFPTQAEARLYRVTTADCTCDVKALLSFGHERDCPYMRQRATRG